MNDFASAVASVIRRLLASPLQCWTHFFAKFLCFLLNAAAVVGVVAVCRHSQHGCKSYVLVLCGVVGGLAFRLFLKHICLVVCLSICVFVVLCVLENWQVFVVLLHVGRI